MTSKAHIKYQLLKEREVRAKEQEFIQELLKDKKLLELENLRLKDQLKAKPKVKILKRFLNQ